MAAARDFLLFTLGVFVHEHREEIRRICNLVAKELQDPRNKAGLEMLKMFLAHQYPETFAGLQTAKAQETPTT